MEMTAVLKGEHQSPVNALVVTTAFAGGQSEAELKLNGFLDNAQLISGDGEGIIVIWSIVARLPIKKLPLSKTPIRALNLLCEDSVAVVGFRDGTQAYLVMNEFAFGFIESKEDTLFTDRSDQTLA